LTEKLNTGVVGGGGKRVKATQGKAGEGLTKEKKVGGWERRRRQGEHSFGRIKKKGGGLLPPKISRRGRKD